MTEIGFYHLTRTGPDQALPQLLDQTWEIVRSCWDSYAALGDS